MVMSTPNAGADCPDVSMLLRMFSTLVAVREEQKSQARLKQLSAGVPVQESKKFAGKSVKLLQRNQAAKKVVPLDTSINEPLLGGNDVKLAQLCQASRKFVTFAVLSCGKLYCSPNAVMLSILLHSFQVDLKFVPLDVSVSENDVKPVQPDQAPQKLVPFDALSGGNDTKLVQFCQVRKKLSAFETSISANDSRLGQFCQVPEKVVTADVSISPTVVKLAEPANELCKLVPKLQPAGVSPNVISSSPAASLL